MPLHLLALAALLVLVPVMVLGYWVLGRSAIGAGRFGDWQ